MQAAQIWRGTQIMERNDPAHIFATRQIEHRLESFYRAQFKIDILGLRQKSRNQFAPPRQRQVVCASFVGMARGDNKWAAQHRHLLLEFLFESNQEVEPKFEEVWRMRHSRGQP